MWNSVYVHRYRIADTKDRVNSDQWEHLHACQSFSRAGVPINGQQIVLPLHLLQGRFWGKDHGKKRELRKGLVSPVLHFLSGMEEWGCEVGLP